MSPERSFLGLSVVTKVKAMGWQPVDFVSQRREDRSQAIAQVQVPCLKTGTSVQGFFVIMGGDQPSHVREPTLGHYVF